MKTDGSRDRRRDRDLRQGRLGPLDAAEPHGPRPDARRAPGLLPGLPANPDHPVLQDFLAVIRPFAADPRRSTPSPASGSTRWSFPSTGSARPRGKARGRAGRSLRSWRTRGRSGMPVEVAATRGTRFKPTARPTPATVRSRMTLTAGAGESRPFRIDCGFEPEKPVVDPDVNVLQLHAQSGPILVLSAEPSRQALNLSGRCGCRRGWRRFRWRRRRGRPRCTKRINLRRVGRHQRTAAQKADQRGRIG